MLFIRVYFAFWKWNKKLHFFHWNQKLFMFSLPFESHKQWRWISCSSKLLRQSCWSISSEVQEILGYLFFLALSPTNLFLSHKNVFFIILTSLMESMFDKTAMLLWNITVEELILQRFKGTLMQIWKFPYIFKFI